ncbi:tail fiber protein [Pseudomonas purpurea]|uniref:phage tail protein n=1 Tax=Pseudomonas purpurea TaxID=3136737 RepID=UPI0032656CCE
MEVFIGTIQAFAFNFSPSGWSTCNGQILPISQYQTVFALLGTYYGGNGTTSFQLPNLQGRFPVGQGNGLGLTPRVIGQFSGTESVVPTLNNLPNHTHTLAGLSATTTVKLANPASNPLSVPTATNSFIGTSGGGPGTATVYSDQQGTTPVPLQGVSTAITGTVSATGTGLPLEVMNPFLVINFSMALNGLFPSRN